MGFISLNEAGNAVVATAEYVDGAIAVPTEGWAIGYSPSYFQARMLQVFASLIT